MNNLTLFLLGLVSIPACLSQNDDKQCFSLSLKPSFPCCKGNEIVYTDEEGDWGIENDKWCGIGNGHTEESGESCFAVAFGYSCCKECEVVYSDEDGDWGVENGRWCGIKDSCAIIDEPVQNETETVIETEDLLQFDIETDDLVQFDIETENLELDDIETETPVQEDIVIEEPIQDDKEIEEPVQSEADFDFSFLKLENKKKNMLYSPLSIKYALNMLQEGAESNTYAEINKLIGNKELPKYESNDKNVTLANGLFIRDIYYDLVKTEYIDTLQYNYDAEVIKDSFQSAANANKWVEDNTLGIIKDILSDEAVSNSDVGMLIINALAMDMAWEVPFNRKDTYGSTFYMDGGETMQATMMSKDKVSSNYVRYHMDSEITVLTMDLKKFNETQFEFMAIMPKENLSGYVENISKEQIDQIDQKLKPTFSTMDGANIRIPKFEFDYDLSLKSDLMKLGIKDAFSEDEANFSKMVDLTRIERNIYVADALHKANIEFTEKGAKAAAATVIVMGGFGAVAARIPQPINIIINKPFMFIIRDKNTNDIWFTGTVYEPNKWENEKESYQN